MSATDHSSARATSRLLPDARGLAQSVRAALQAAANGLAAGWRAAGEHQRLSGMSDSQLRARGLSRSAIPGALYEKHFATLDESPDTHRPLSDARRRSLDLI